MIAPRRFRSAIAASITRSTSALYPINLSRTTPRRAPRSPLRSSDAVYSRLPIEVDSAVIGSASSFPASTPSKIAASVTVRAIGPAVSWLCAIGMIPVRLTSPSVGFIPTNPLLFAGETMEPSVSVPTATAARFAAIEDPDPELDPDGLRSSA